MTGVEDEGGATTAAGDARARYRVRRRWVVGGSVLVGLIAATAAIWGLVAYNAAVIDTVGQVDFARPLPIPELAERTVTADGTVEFSLDLQAGEHDFGTRSAATWGVNGAHFGPTLRIQRGEDVRMRVTNDLDEATTLHWHGMELPARMDGGPHQMIEPGATWTPEWTVDQPATTLWYHPHLHGSTMAHAYRGLAGMIIVDEETPAGVPGEYGVDDLPLIVQDVRFDGEGGLDESEGLSNVGILGDQMTANGTIGAYAEITAEATRFRVLNASVGRILTFVFDDGRGFDVIGGDGGLLPAPVPVERLQLTPGERAEIVVRMTPGERIVLRSEAAAHSDRFNGTDDRFDVLELRAADVLTPSPELPAVLDPAATPDLDEADAVRTRSFALADPKINGLRMDMSRIDEVVTVGETEIWEVFNTDAKVHNFHVHNAQFRVLSVGGAPPAPEFQGGKDTVYVPVNSSVRLLVRFERNTDPDWPYMYHCHILRHEDNGMMGQFVVVDPGQSAGTVPVPAEGGPGHDGH